MLLRIFTFLLLIVLAAQASAQVDITLKESVEVHSRDVKLSDIAILHSSTDQSYVEILGKMIIATMVHINQPLRIDAPKLEHLIVRQEPALRDRFHLSGAAAVMVVLPGTEFPLSQVMDSAKTFLRTELNKQPSPFEIVDGRIERQLLLIPKGQLELIPRFSGSSNPAKKMNVTVDIFVNNSRFDSIPVALEINMTKRVYRLTHSVARGKILKKDDYEIEEEQIDRSTRIAALLDPNTDISNMRVRRNMPANSVLYQEDVEVAPLVTHNQKVVAELKTNGIVIEKTAIAQTDGALGQLIKVADSDSSSIYFAKVIAQGRVEVK